LKTEINLNTALFIWKKLRKNNNKLNILSVNNMGKNQTEMKILIKYLIEIFVSNTKNPLSHSRWAILCYKWNLSVRQFCTNLSATINNNDGNTEKDSSYGFVIQLIAWGLPAVQTIAVLVARLVDADELLGKYL
jgi:Frizzled/Smoothened family membrane region